MTAAMKLKTLAPWVSQVAPGQKNFPANEGDARDMGPIPGVGNGSALQYSCLENSME